MKPIFFLAFFILTAQNLIANTYTASPSLVAPSGYFLVYDVQGTLSFEPSTRWNLPKDIKDAGAVSGQSCAYALSIPLSLALSSSKISGAYGENGYNKALKSILKVDPNIAGIYDVKVDRHTISVLGVFTRSCLELSARAFKNVTSSVGGVNK